MDKMKVKPMLAYKVGNKPITEEQFKEGVYVQPKLDGVRCVIQSEYAEWHGKDGREYSGEVVKAYSRTGKEWKNINHILKALRPFFAAYPNVVLDGELYNHGLQRDFEKIISLVRKTKPTDDDRAEAEIKIQFHIYDIIVPKGGHKNKLVVGENSDMLFDERNKFLRLNFGRHKVGSYFGLLPFKICKSYDDINNAHQIYLDSGYEGSIVRINAPYEQKRSYTLQKVKDFHDTEATIYGFVEGVGKRKGTLGKFLMEDDHGVKFGCPPGKGYNYADLTHILENINDYVGKRATFTYFERTKAGNYRHPMFKTVRDYE